MAICVLKGATFFYTDLVRRLTIPVLVDFFQTSSYGASTSAGEIRIKRDIELTVRGRDVLLVEDIIDTGLTMQYLLEFLKTRSPASVKICTLLEKPENAKARIDIAYKGFVIPNEFVVGYGLDYAGLYRNVPYIGTL